jgi:squalene synthase HpnC
MPAVRQRGKGLFVFARPPTRRRPLEGQTANAYNLSDAFAYCQRVAVNHYENFTVGSWLLPRAIRRHVYAVYAFCRHVDDLGDEAPGERLTLLDDWQAELERCYHSAPRHPILVALQETIRCFAIPPQPFLKLIEANRMDQRTSRYPTFAELLNYCDHSANPVGHLFLYLFGYADAGRQGLADATCTALQLTNFWQDISIDLSKGRVYIPQEDMARFGYRDEDLQQGIVNDNFRALMAFEVGRTRELFAKGLGLLDVVDGRLKVDVKLFSLGGLAVLEALERNGYDVFRRRPRLSRWRKASLFVRGLLPGRPEVKTGRR